MAHAAGSVTLTGTIWSRAILIVNGAPPKTVAVGEIFQGVKLVSLQSEQAGKEIATRFDFKGSSGGVESVETGKSRQLLLLADSGFQLGQVREVLLAKLAKRGVDVRFVDFSAKPEKLGGDKLRLTAPVKTGIDSDTARKVQTLVKQSKLKVQAAIQGDAPPEGATSKANPFHGCGERRIGGSRGR